MIFTSFAFLIFFPLVFGVYWSLKTNESRLRLLLAASCVFYGWWDWRFLALMFAVIGLAYVAALGASAPGASAGRRRLWLWFGVVSNLLILGVFKYFNFFADNLIALINQFGGTLSEPTLRILLPVGVSFYIFQALSYVVDVYRGDVRVEKRFSRVALYIAFFPQLVAGPILRASKFLPQLETTKRWSDRRFASAARTFLIGFLYKAVIADNLATIADPVFADMAEYSNWAVVGASVVFAVQLYFDFAGYTLMAVGSARALGYHLPRNFAYPFTAASATEYWRRWHMSLSTFLRDYLFIPLGGNRGSTLFYYRNLMITMFLGGLWHGAAWNYILWGTLMGLALIAHKMWRQYVERPYRLVERIHPVVYWIFGLVVTQVFIIQQRGLFRVETFADGLSIFGAFLGYRDGGSLEITWVAWLTLLLPAIDGVIGRRRELGWSTPRFEQRPAVYWGLFGIVVALVLSIYPLEAAPFVYFQF